jgi:hypothetical protein
MVTIDHFTGWAEVYPLAKKSNEAVWERLRNDFVPRHGAPHVLVSDQGSEFKGAAFSEWLTGHCIEHRRTTPYHPQSNGKTERLNKTLKNMLQKLVNGQRADWEERIGAALMAYRTNVSTTTGFTPFMLHHARPARMAISRLLDGHPGHTLENRLQLQEQIMKEAEQHTRDSRHYNRQRLARRANAGKLQVGDRVILKAQEALTMTAKWDFGYTITRVRGNVVYLLHPQTGKTTQVNRDKVRLVSPDVAWDEVRPRPRRVQKRVIRYKRPDTPPREESPARRPLAADNTEAPTTGPANDMEPPTTNEVTPPQDDVMDVDTTQHASASVTRGTKRAMPQSWPVSEEYKRPTTRAEKRRLDSIESTQCKEGRWDLEKMACLDFVYSSPVWDSTSASRLSPSQME